MVGALHPESSMFYIFDRAGNEVSGPYASEEAALRSLAEGWDFDDTHGWYVKLCT